MKNSTMLVATSLLAIALATLHLSDDIVRGFESGRLENFPGVAMFAAWLYGTLALAERRSGHVIMLLGSLLGAVMPLAHMRGAGLGRIAATSGAFMFTWTLIALGTASLCLFLLSVHGLWRLRRSSRSA